MQFANLNFSSAASHCSGNSLSAFLCRDNGENNNYNLNNSNDDGDNDYDAGGVSSYHPSPRAMYADWGLHPSQNPSSQHGIRTPRSGLHGRNNDGRLISQQGSGKNSEQNKFPNQINSRVYGSPTESVLPGQEDFRSGLPTIQSQGRYTPPTGIVQPIRSFRRGSNNSTGIAGARDRDNSRDKEKEKSKLYGLDDSSFYSSLRAYSIISSILIHHCIVGNGKFLNTNSCSATDLQIIPNYSRRTSDSTVAEAPYSHEKYSMNNNYNEMNTNNSNQNINTNSLNKNISTKSVQLPPKGIVEGIRKVNEKQINIVYSVREFLDRVPNFERRQIIPLLSEITNHSSDANTRLLKLLSPLMFNSCLPHHINNAKKIGDGGFGCVYRISCDASCSKCGTWESYRGKPLQLCHSLKYGRLGYCNTATNEKEEINYCDDENDNTLDLSERNITTQSISIQQSKSESELEFELESDLERTTNYNMKRNYQQFNNDKKSINMYSSMVRKDSGCSSSASRRVYAVKRIPRERSMYDNPLLYEVFNEITCLQLLAGNGGVRTFCYIIYFYLIMLYLTLLYCIFYYLFIFHYVVLSIILLHLLLFCCMFYYFILYCIFLLFDLSFYLS